MPEYYILINNVQHGPFTLEDLKGQNLAPDTKVWKNGLSNWVQASTLPELKDIIYNVPPQQPQEQPPMPKTWLVESILAMLLCCLPFGIVGIVYATKVEGQYLGGRYNDALNSSREAKKWTLVSFFTGVSIIVIYLLFLAVAILSSR